MAVNFGNLPHTNHERESGIEYIRMSREEAQFVGNKTLKAYNDLMNQLQSATKRFDNAADGAKTAAFKAFNDVNSLIK